MPFKKHLLGILCFMALAALPSVVAWATSCVGTTAGTIEWMTASPGPAIVFCDGTNWNTTDNGATTATCPNPIPTGEFMFTPSPIPSQSPSPASSGLYRYCGNVDGHWHSMRGTIIGNCGGLVAGQLTWDSGNTAMEFCDAKNQLWNMANVTSCNEIIVGAGAGLWKVPTSWNNASNSISAIGGGGSGACGNNGGAGGPGGAGGNYSVATNVALATITVSYNIGAGGAGPSPTPQPGHAGGDTWFCNSMANCATYAGTAVILGAKGGPGGLTKASPLPAPSTSPYPVASNIPSGVGFSGGMGATDTTKGGGGGGAAGPSGAGVKGATDAGGIGNVSLANGGGSGGAAGAPATAASPGTEWTANAAPSPSPSASPARGGSGGGGGGGSNATSAASHGGAGGNYGGGGGGAGGKASNENGSGAPGALYIHWNSTVQGTCD